KMGLSLSDYVVTEAGFGFDLGAEKFLDIKCVSSGLKPGVAVLVATIRALKYHGGVKLDEIKKPNAHAVENGLENLKKHIENIRKFNICPVVAINKFADDTVEELEVVKNLCNKLGIRSAITTAHAEGGRGAVQLAEAVVEVLNECKSDFKPLYDWGWSVERKIETIAKQIYGANAIDYTAQAKDDLKKIESLNLDKLPVCIAKTQKSLSDNPKLLGRPENFIVTVREIEIAAGAGFVIPITGNIMRMPGLPEYPAAEKIDIDSEGRIKGLF